MKTILKMALLAMLSLAVVGCGSNVQVPETTVAAAYIDLQKAYANGKCLAGVLIKALPKEMREGAKKEYEETIRKIEENIKDVNPKWAVVAFCGGVTNMASPTAENFAVAVRISSSDEVIAKMLKEKMGVDAKPDKRKKGNVYDVGAGLIGVIGGKYLVLATSKDAFNDMFSLYCGKGKASDDFDGLADLSGNTIARFSTAPFSSLVKRFELTEAIEKFGKASKDEDLAEAVLGMGAISLDLNMDDNDVGLALRVVCNSSDDAMILDHFFKAIAFCARLGSDLGAYAAEDYKKLEGIAPSKVLAFVKEGRDAFNVISRIVKAERDGKVAQLLVSLDADDIVDVIEKSANSLEVRKVGSMPRNQGLELEEGSHGIELTPDELPPSLLVIDVDKAGRVSIPDMGTVSDEMITKEVKKRVDMYGTGFPCMIRADKKTPHKYVSRVMDRCTAAGVSEFSFIASLPRSEGERKSEFSKLNAARPSLSDVVMMEEEDREDEPTPPPPDIEPPPDEDVDVQMDVPVAPPNTSPKLKATPSPLDTMLINPVKNVAPRPATGGKENAKKAKKDDAVIMIDI